MKNRSPQEILLFASGTLSLSLFLFLIIINQLLKIAIPWYIIFTTPVVNFIICYLLFNYFIEKFIYGKIKLIYKTIHDLKAPKSRHLNGTHMNKDIIRQVEKDVNEWTANQSREIEDLKQMATYRKEFIGNVTHELKTPIFNIQGYLHTLIDGGLQDDKINKSYLYKASNNLDRLNNIVEDLDIISQIETDALILDITKFDIIKLINEVFESLEMQADMRNIKLRMKEGTHKSTFVMADRDRIRQVLTNLIANSIRYGNENGRTTVGVYDMDKNILVEVSDNGIGIAEEHLPRLFERFYRVDQSRSRELGGTGLGLSIVKHILEAHGQTVNVRSALGAGSTFGFTLKKT